jgi:hypothetical protein
MEGQRVPNLEEMDEEQARQFLTSCIPTSAPKKNTTCATKTT